MVVDNLPHRPGVATAGAFAGTGHILRYPLLQVDRNAGIMPASVADDAGSYYIYQWRVGPAADDITSNNSSE